MIPLYCVCTTNAERIGRMQCRFNQLGLYHEFVTSPGTCMDGHLLCLEKFVHTGSNFGIVCEDDIHLRRDFPQELPVVLEQFKKLELDILLLGYLLDFPLMQHQLNFGDMPSVTPIFSYHSYGSQQWGTQMYMINRSYATQILRHFGPSSGYRERADLNPAMTPHASDHVITKETSRKALIWPMMAVEEGVIRSEVDPGVPTYQSQNEFHQRVFTANYSSELFV